MGGQELNAAEPGVELGPELGEGGSVAHHVPGDAVNVGEDEPGARRTDQAGNAVDDADVFDLAQGDGAGAVTTVIGGFEIDGGEAIGRAAGQSGRYLIGDDSSGRGGSPTMGHSKRRPAKVLDFYGRVIYT